MNKEQIIDKQIKERTMNPSQLVKKDHEYLMGLTKEEKATILGEFDKWVKLPVYTPSAVNYAFSEFAEEVFYYELCEVCGVHYHVENPCPYH